MLLNGVAHIISFKNGYLTFWDFQELIPDLFSVLIRNGESYKVQLFVYKFVFTWVILNVILVFMFYLFKGLKFCGVFNTWNCGLCYYGLSLVNFAILLERQSGKTTGLLTLHILNKSIFIDPSSYSLLIQTSFHLNNSSAGPPLSFPIQTLIHSFYNFG